MAIRDGTSIVALSDVVSAIIAPSVTNAVAPAGRYRAAASAIGAAETRSCSPGSAPRPTTDINR